MGLDTAGVNALFQSLGLDLGSFGRVRNSKSLRDMLPQEDKGFLPPVEQPPDPPLKEKPDTESSTKSLADALNQNSWWWDLTM